MLQFRWIASGASRLTLIGGWNDAKDFTMEEMVGFPKAAKNLGYTETNIEYRTISNNKEE